LHSIAGPIIIGTSLISPLRFAIFNAIGALLWAPLIGGIGFLFGEAASALLGELRDIELWLLLGLAAAACAYMLLQRLRARARAQPAKDH
jgi:membrane protein DedA with SNARE-associated domain